MRETLENMRDEAIDSVAKIDDLKQLDDLRRKYLGKKGELTKVLRGMGRLPAQERPIIGSLANEVRTLIQTQLDNQRERLEERALEDRLSREAIDVTMPGARIDRGNLHPLTSVQNEIVDIFIGMGFIAVEGPDVELDYYNFEALNIPKDHPARDIQDTFYINDEMVLRTHTSPVQVRVMEAEEPPIKIVVPGRVYRSDDVDATHSPIFHQIEGLVIDKNVTMADLKGALDVFAKELFGKDTKTRFRPHYFPFTEPSVEVDATCVTCGGDGCRICSNTGWIEILGAGMVHPNVLRYGNIDPSIYSGYAFGLGLDRIVNLKYGIDDIRLLYENDVRFLKQF
ncbi:MAG: phenylalanine--tRNA ligase subunit alpha [Clostridiales bacterium]|mgnify:CR=1 FL=1|nr:phenylalanine--tRNA ligase subunit alpha [Clostridiales bacterium]